MGICLSMTTACLRESEITEICGQGYVAGFDSKRENVGQRAEGYG